VNHDAELRNKEMKRLHEQVTKNVEKTNATYKAKANKYKKKMEFIPGDLVWLHLKK